MFSRDATGAATPGNLFAPFYGTFVPATAADAAYSSGTMAGGANDFLDPIFAPYSFWERFATHTRSGSNDCRNALGVPYPFPEGAESASVYTDEHGEGRIQLAPGVGLRLTSDANGRCDLGLHGSPSAVGSEHSPTTCSGRPSSMSARS